MKTTDYRPTKRRKKEDDGFKIEDIQADVHAKHEWHFLVKIGILVFICILNFLWYSFLMNIVR